MKNPKNKFQFQKLLKFADKIKRILQKNKINPVVWGGLAYFAYTKDENVRIGDVDFLVPEKKINEIKNILNKRKIKYKYVNGWNLIIIKNGKLKVEIDPIEWYYKRKKRGYKKFSFERFKFKVVPLNVLIKMYSRASKVSKDKPKQHKERLENLKLIG